MMVTETFKTAKLWNNDLPKTFSFYEEFNSEFYVYYSKLDYV